jgi:signal transduction histidine kinase
MVDIESGGMPLEVLPDPHVVLDAAGVLLAANHRFDRRLLAEPRAMIHLATMHESRVELAADLEGRRRVYSVSWSPCRWDGVAARLVRLLDITEDRLHCESLEQSVHTLEEALDALPASLLMVDAHGVIISANARWHVSARANGLIMPNAGIGASYLDVCDRAALQGEDEARVVAAALRDVLDRKSLAFEMDYSIPPIGDRGRQWFRLAVNAIGAHPGAVIQHAEITDTRRQQQERIDALAHFKAVFEGALDGIVIYDDAMRVLRSNDAADALVDESQVTYGQSTLLDLVVPADHQKLQLQHAELLSRGSSRGLLRLRSRHDTVVEVEYAARANVVPGRHVAVVRDITTARQLEAQLRQAQKMEAVGQLTGGIAHDFNNILTVILAHSDLLLDEPALGEDMRDGLTQILRASQRGADMVRKLMAFGRREQLRLEHTRIDTTVQELTALLRRVLPETIDVRFSAPAETPLVLADSTAVQQILLNLATNARDAMRDSGGELLLRVQLVPGPARQGESRGPIARERHVLVSVVDTGCGMSADTLAHMFEPFFTTKAPGEGTGLGMSMVYGLMQQMGGHITVDSHEGQGTSVHLHFSTVPEDRATPPSVPVLSVGGRGGSERILLVEDDDAIRTLTARVLRRAGYDVVVAKSGNEAAAQLEAQAIAPAPGFALVVSDVVMPNGDGARVLEATRRWAAGARIVWVTGYAGSEYAEGPVHAPCDAPIIQKPWTTTEFLTRVRTVLDGPPNVPLDATVTHDPLRTG